MAAIGSLHKVPSAGALVLAVPAYDDECQFRLSVPVDTDVLGLRLIVMDEVSHAPGEMSVSGPTIAGSSQAETKTGFYQHVRFAPGETGIVIVRLAPAKVDRFITVRRRCLAESGPGMPSIRFPRCPVPSAAAAPPATSRLIDIFASNPRDAFETLTRLSSSGRRDAALALLASLAETDVEVGAYHSLLMLLQDR